MYNVVNVDTWTGHVCMDYVFVAVSRYSYWDDYAWCEPKRWVQIAALPAIQARAAAQPRAQTWDGRPWPSLQVSWGLCSCSRRTALTFSKFLEVCVPIWDGRPWPSLRSFLRFVPRLESPLIRSHGFWRLLSLFDLTAVGVQAYVILRFMMYTSMIHQA